MKQLGVKIYSEFYKFSKNGSFEELFFVELLAGITLKIRVNSPCRICSLAL